MTEAVQCRYQMVESEVLRIDVAWCTRNVECAANNDQQHNERDCVAAHVILQSMNHVHALITIFIKQHFYK
jgi:hypothetical protein